ncbi:MAG: hypothetical protein OXG33_06265 [Chloroflexi bacterium]|nr:hypothetical protein [Chloroflexota bacterium]
MLAVLVLTGCGFTERTYDELVERLCARLEQLGNQSSVLSYERRGQTYASYLGDSELREIIDALEDLADRRRTPNHELAARTSCPEAWWRFVSLTDGVEHTADIELDRIADGVCERLRNPETADWVRRRYRAEPDRELQVLLVRALDLGLDEERLQVMLNAHCRDMSLLALVRWAVADVGRNTRMPFARERAPETCRALEQALSEPESARPRVVAEVLESERWEATVTTEMMLIAVAARCPDTAAVIDALLE